MAYQQLGVKVINRLLTEHNVQQALEVSGAVKTLGVVLDSELSFSDHVTYATQCALGKLRGIYIHRVVTYGNRIQAADLLPNPPRPVSSGTAVLGRETPVPWR
ncbi:hypothetical protein J6590_091728, partial [Homalodisca vitripennis]